MRERLPASSFGGFFSNEAGDSMVLDGHEPVLDDVERTYPDGMSVQQIVDACVAAGEHLTEATFRKYVQLGLLPRSVRVGKKGKHRGSQGLYPASTVRQVQLIRRLMGQGFTIEEIQVRFLFVGADIGALAKELERVLSQLERTQQPRTEAAGRSLVGREIEEARALSVALVEKLRAVERRLTMQARLDRAAV